MIALVRRETGASSVAAIIEGGGAAISWINVGEVFYIVARREGLTKAGELVELLREQVEQEEVEGELVLRAARIKAIERVSYADAFAVATAERHGVPLVTGDPEILALARPRLTVLDPRVAG